MNIEDQNVGMTEPITIIGGGIGGLTLARVLYVNGIPSKVYEIDTSPNARKVVNLIYMNIMGKLHLKKLI